MPFHFWELRCPRSAYILSTGLEFKKRLIIKATGSDAEYQVTKKRRLQYHWGCHETHDELVEAGGL
jgi:hypothetical protein